MTDPKVRQRRSRAHPRLRTVAVASLVLAACVDTAGPSPPANERGVVLNSLEVSLTVFSVESPAQPLTLGLAPEGSPVSLAVSERWAAVPLGFVPALVVVDLGQARVARTVALPPGSGATGVAFLNDSTVLVANPGRNSVSPVNVRSGSLGTEVGVGTYPQAVVRAGSRVGVLNAELGPDFQPLGPGSVSVLDARTLEVQGTVRLTGENPGSAAVGPDGRLYVVNSGRFGRQSGSLSVVDLEQRREVEHHGGFGEFPFAAGFAPGTSLLHVGSFGYGVAVWDAARDAFVRSPGNSVKPEGIPSVSGLAFDATGRLYTLRPDCESPSVANRLGPTYQVQVVVPVGLCPIAIAFAPGPR